jgi:hypothetical protein
VATVRVRVCDVDDGPDAVTYSITVDGDVYLVDLCAGCLQLPLQEILGHSKKRAKRGPRKRTVKVAAVPKGRG